jgi:hypothetical protein
MFSRDEHGDPLATETPGLRGDASSLIALDWHPRLPRGIHPPKSCHTSLLCAGNAAVAVALSNDSVYFYDLETRGWSNLMLCQTLQKNVVEVRFDPLGGNTLAVLGSNGLCLWTLVDASKAAWMRILQPTDWRFPMKPVQSRSRVIEMYLPSI